MLLIKKCRFKSSVTQDQSAMQEMRSVEGRGKGAIHHSAMSTEFQTPGSNACNMLPAVVS